MLLCDVRVAQGESSRGCTARAHGAGQLRADTRTCDTRDPRRSRAASPSRFKKVVYSLMCTLLCQGGHALDEMAHARRRLKRETRRSHASL